MRKEAVGHRLWTAMPIFSPGQHWYKANTRQMALWNLSAFTFATLRVTAVIGPVVGGKFLYIKPLVSQTTSYRPS